MTDNDKKAEIQKITEQLLEAAIPKLKKAIKKSLNCGAIALEDWDENNPDLIPKAIIIAILEDGANQYKSANSAFGRKVIKEAKNIKLFL